MDALVKAAQKEGKLNLITIPRDYANYGEAMDIFSKAFGIKITDDNPDGSSAYEIQTIKTAPALKQPDVVDLSISYAKDKDNEKLFAPYKVKTWDDIPTQWKNTNGTWFGNYSSQVVIAYDASLSFHPTKIQDFLNPDFKKLVDKPTTNIAMMLMASSVANGGSLDNVQKGIDFWKEVRNKDNISLNQSNTSFIENPYVLGIKVTDRISTLKNIVGFSPTSKLSLESSVNAKYIKDSNEKSGKIVNIVKPSDAAVTGTPYVFAINKKAPHPAAARLWVEYMMSENNGKLLNKLPSTKGKSGSSIFKLVMGGQNIFSLGGAIPININAMKKKNA